MPDQPDKTTRYIVAGSLRHAGLAAEIDHSWPRIRPGTWIDKEGVAVRYIPSIHYLLGIERGSIVYLAYGWWSNRDLRGLREEVQARGLVLKVIGDA